MEETLAKLGGGKEVVKKETKKDFPTDPKEQLQLAIKAVFASWNGRRAKDYRRINKIDDNLGTAVNIQTMVYGNLGEDSGTGVAFTRDPNTGERVLYGEYLTNAQGEDVVAGIRTPQDITEYARTESGSDKASMETASRPESPFGRRRRSVSNSMPAGVWLDRIRSRRRLMIAADLGRAALIGSIPLAYLLGVLAMPQLYVVGFLSGSLGVIFDLSWNTLFVSVTERDRYVEAMALLNGSRSLASVGGTTISQDGTSPLGNRRAKA